VTRALAVVGNVNIDLIMGPVTPWPQPGTETVVDDDQLRVGGSAGNTALAWQAMNASFCCAANVGDDAYGTWLQDTFGNNALHWPRTATSTTVSVGLTHPDGERTFFTTKGHIQTLSWPQVRAMLEAAQLDNGILLLAGGFLTPDLCHDYPSLFDWADHHGVEVALDTGWPTQGWTPHNTALVQGWVRRCKHILFNEVEATTLTGTATPLAALHALQDMAGTAAIVIKAGPQGAFALSPTRELIHASGLPIKVLDTIGAGDIFNAGYLLGRAQGKDLPTAMHMGVQTAAKAISSFPRQYI